MGTSIFLLLAICATGIICAPLQVQKPYLCAKTCLHPSSDNLAYNVSYTYEYEFIGKSKVLAGNQVDKSGQMDVQATIEIGWVNPCNAVIQIKNAKVLGETDITSQLLTAHPLMVGVQNGLVTEVCAHPNDEPTSLNFKRGFISQIQNSLPSFSTNFDNRSFEEKDIVGTCPTEYSIKADKKNPKQLLITKHKDHKKCKSKYSNLMTKLAIPLLMSQVPAVSSKSYSFCTQEVKNQIVTSVKCKDVNDFTARVGTSDKRIKALQTSQLTLKQKTRGVPDYKGVAKKTSIQFEVSRESQNGKFTAMSIDLLKDVCKLMKDTIHNSAARQIAKLISFLYRTPDKDLLAIHKQINAGKICDRVKEMETLYLDALIVVRNGGAVRIVLDQIKQEKLTGLRPYLFAAKLHLVEDPSIELIKVAYSSIDDPNIPVPIKLAVGSLVKKYCQQHSHCLQDGTLKNFYQSLSRNILSSCSNSKNEYSSKMKALIALKVAGNAGNLNESIQKVILSCLQSEEADLPVRVEAAESFRQSQLTTQVTNVLSKMVYDYTLPAEVQIACYLAVYDKATQWQLEEILDQVKRQSNSQVRSFVLSHMRNLQLTENPDLQKLRYTMMPLVIPQDFRRDASKYSSNFDISKYWKGTSVGAALDSNIVYSPPSLIPRQMRLNLTTSYLGNINNVLETGLRMEDMESLLDTLFSPNGLLSSEVMAQAMKKTIALVKEHGIQLLHRDKMHKQLQNIYDQVLSHISKSQGKDTKTKVDAFIRLFGEEFGFLSFSGYPKNVVSSKMGKDIMETSMEGLVQLFIKALDKDYSKVFMTQEQKINYISTVQGIPIQLKYVVTLIFRMKASSRLEKGEYRASLRPQSLLSCDGFVGYSLGGKAGIRANYTIGPDPRVEVKVTHANNNFDVQLDVPSKQQMLYMERNIYLFSKRPGEGDAIPACGDQTQLNKASYCSALMEKKFGVKLCNRETSTAKSQAECFTTHYSREISLEKVKRDSPIMKFKVMAKYLESEASLKLQLLAPSAATPSLGMVDLQYKNRNNNDMVLLKIQTPSQAVKVIKASLMTEQSDGGSKYELVLFSANKDTINAATDKMVKIVTGFGKANERVGKVFFMATTMNQLRKHLLADINLQSLYAVQSKYKLIKQENYNDIQIPEITLERFEVDLGMLNYRTKNYIRFAQNTNKMNVMSETKGPKGLLLKFDSSVLWEGSIRSENAKSRVTATVETSKNSYDIVSEVRFAKSDKYFLIDVKKPNKQKVATLEAKMKHNKFDNLETLMEIDIPSKMKPYQLEFSTTETGSNVRMVKFMIKKESKPLYSIYGPVKFIWENEIFEQKSNLTLKLNQVGKYLRLEYDIYKSPKKQDLLVKIVKTNNVLVGKLDARQQSDWSSQSVKLLVPNFTDTSVKLKTTRYTATFSSEVSLSQKYKKRRRITADWMVSLLDKKVDAELSLDADSNDKRVILYKGTYDWRKDQTEIGSRGTLTVFENKYKYLFKTNLGLRAESSNLPYELHLEFIDKNTRHMKLMTRYGNVFKLDEVKLLDSYQLTGALTTFSSEQYEVQSILKQSQQIDNSFYQTMYNLTVTSPEYRVIFGRKYDGPADPNSIQAHEAGLYSQASLLVKEKETIVCDMNLERKGKEVDINLGAVINDYNVQLHSSQQKALYFSVNENGVKVIDADCDIQNPKEWRVVISSKNGKQSRSLSRSLGSTTEIAAGKLISKGTLEFDIFKNAKPLTIEVKLMKKLQLKYILEAIMNIPNQPKRPNFMAELELTPKVSVLDVTLRKDVKSAVIAKLEANSKQVSSDSYNVQAKLTVPKETIELSALVQNRSSLSCMGRTLNGTMSSRTYGPINVMAAACGPSYLELGLKRPEDAAMALVKLGVKSYSSIKLALDAVYYKSDKPCVSNECNYCNYTWNLYENKWMTKQNVFLLGAKLKHSQLLQFLARCNSNIIKELKTDLWQPSKKIVKNIVTTLISDVQSAGQVLLPKNLQVQPNLKKFATVVLQKIEKLPQLFNWWSKLVGELKASLKKIANYLANLNHDIYDYVKQRIEAILKYIFGAQIQNWKDISVEKVAQLVKKKLTQLEIYLIDRLASFEVKTVFPDAWKIIKEFLIDHRNDIIKYIDYFNDNFVPKAFRVISDIVVAEIDKWLMNLKNQYLGPILVPLLSGTTGVSYGKQGGWMALTVPIKTPVASVYSAVANLGFPLRKLSLTLPRTTFAFSTQFASRKVASLTTTDIITFDGLGIPVIPSECKILLIKEDTVAIQAAILNKEHMDLEVLYPDFITKVELRQNKPIKVVPLVKGDQHPDIKIHRVNPKKIIITAPGIKAIVTDKSVLFESTMDKPVGILGCHDNEMANDAPPHMDVVYTPASPNASHQVSRKSALHFFEKYRNNTHCAIHL